LYVHGYAATSNESGDKLKDEVDRVTRCLPGGRLAYHTQYVNALLNALFNC